MVTHDGFTFTVPVNVWRTNTASAGWVLCSQPRDFDISNFVVQVSCASMYPTSRSCWFQRQRTRSGEVLSYALSLPSSLSQGFAWPHNEASAKDRPFSAKIGVIRERVVAKQLQVTLVLLFMWDQIFFSRFGMQVCRFTSDMRLCLVRAHICGSDETKIEHQTRVEVLSQRAGRRMPTTGMARH